MWIKLANSGIHGKMLNSIKSLYQDVRYAVKVDNHITLWFDVNLGLKQGCLLSTTFNIYINDLSALLELSNKEILIDGKRITHLLYADDLILMGDSESDLQYLLDILATWCRTNNMAINCNKTKIMHFRNNSAKRIEFCFTCCGSKIDIVDTYKYLGLLLNETLGYD